MQHFSDLLKTIFNFIVKHLGSERDLQSLLSSMSQQQLMQLFGNVGGMSGLSSLLVPSDGYCYFFYIFILQVK